jgi:hypothetical protein
LKSAGAYLTWLMMQKISASTQTVALGIAVPASRRAEKEAALH